MAKRYCRPLPPLTTKDEARFWAKVDKSGGPEACWPWMGCRKPHGYGEFGIRDGVFMAHRVAFRLSHGKDAAPFDVLHSCDFPPCCNPLHLAAGTPKDNALDSKDKGRRKWKSNHPFVLNSLLLPHGEKHHRAKLKKADIVEIRALAATGEWLHRELAVKFGISKVGITNIVNRKMWKHVP